MTSGRATVEIVMDPNDVGTRDITGTNALGMPNLVWARIEVSEFRTTELGHVYVEVGRLGTSWTHKGGARNFVPQG
jgi:hypothetical protein